MRLFLLIILLPTVIFGQTQSVYQELGIKPPKNKNIRDTTIVNQLDDIAYDSLFLAPEKSQRYAREQTRLAQAIEYPLGIVNGYLSMYRAKIYLNELDSSLYYTKLSLAKAQQIKNPKKIVASYEAIGNVLQFQGKYDEGVEYYLEAIREAEKVDSSWATSLYLNLGLGFQKTGNYEKAKEYQLKAISMAKKYGDSTVLTSAYNNLGIIYKNQGRLDLAMETYKKGLAIARAINRQKSEADLLQNMANILFDQGKFDQAMELFEESMKYTLKNGNYYMLYVDYHNLSVHLNELGRYKESFEAAQKALDYAEKANNLENIVTAYELNAEAAFALNRLDEAYAYMTHAIKYKDSLNAVNINNSMLNSIDAFETEKKRMADSLRQVQDNLEKQKNDEINRQKVRSRDYLLIFLAILIIGAIIGGRILIKRKNEIQAKNKIVESQNKEITDSINYAKRIQQSMIENVETWDLISKKRFEFFRPKDVVSGDFYWSHYIHDRELAIWVIADCTGHGVPGAFMSMLGISLLNEIVVDKGIVDAATILNLLREKIISTLDQKGGSESKDGMDLALCVWDKKTNQLEFCGANNPIWIIRHNDAIDSMDFKRILKGVNSNLSLIEIGAQKMPIGYYHDAVSTFKSRKIQLKNGDVIVASTDGFADQFGGDQGKKLKSKPFKEILISMQETTIDNQSERLAQFFDDWKGEHDQLDDVCVIGIQV